MQPRSIGIVSGAGGPIGSTCILKEIIAECQKKYGSRRSFEFPCINFFSFPYSETLLVEHNASSVPSKELSYSIQQLKLNGIDIVVVPCFTMSSYLTYRSYGVELIEVGAVLKAHLEKQRIEDPLVLCSERTRVSGYCDKHFKCHYPSAEIQKEISHLYEEAQQGNKIHVEELLAKLPDQPIICAATLLNALMEEVDDPRWINPNKLLVQHVVHRCFEATNFEIGLPISYGQ